MYAAAVSVALAAVVSLIGHGALSRADNGPESVRAEAEAITMGE
ncbi:hypothetical protein [Nocardiopsis halotolerans]|nr:hypothetical protein [Nocardiopsis halotolerans]